MPSLHRSEESFEVEPPAGGNTELLALRVPEALLQALQALSEARGTSVPAIARSMLWYHLTPALLRQSLHRLQRRELRELSSVQALNALLADFRSLSDRLETVASTVESVRGHAREKVEEVEEIAAAWSAELNAVLTELEEQEERLNEPIFSLEEETEGEAS